jgi:hypothetical protein
MNKVCTTIKQSRKLFELGIDIKTADMYYMYRHWEIDENTVGAQSDAHIGFNSDFYYGADNGKTYHYVPAWSLTALLGLIPKFSLEKDVSGNEGYQLHYNYNTVYYDDPIDAAFDMICWLKEHNKI